MQVSKQLSSSAAVLKAGPPPIEKPAVLTAADLEKPVCIRLEETETIWLLHLPGGCINADTDEGKAVETANSKWAVLQQRIVLWISSFATFMSEQPQASQNSSSAVASTLPVNESFTAYASTRV